MRRSAQGLALALSLALVAPPVVLSMPRAAWAQAKRSIRDTLAPEARGHWDAGVDLAKHNKWEGARASFKTAYELSKNPRVLFNVAIAEKETGQFAAAVEWLKRELSEGKGQLTREEEANIRAVIDGLEKFVAELTIEINEKDAEIFINNEKIDNSKLPGPFTVPGGRQHVRAIKAGFGEAVESTELGGGRKGTVTLKLEPLQKMARVNVSVVGPPNAIVKIDGKEVGPAPYVGLVPVAADPHQFSAEAPGYVTATQSVIVKEGEPMNLTLQLALEQQKGKLVVLARPEGAAIEIDGAYVGSTKWEGPIDARIHQVAVKKQGYYTWTHDVDVPKGGERSVSATLNEDRNTSFVPWLVGTVVVGAALAVGVFLVAREPDQQPASGTLSPFKLPTASFQPGLHF
jgi:hypothetical protein